MPDKRKKYGSKSSRRKPPRGSSSTGSQQPDHARRHEPPQPPTIDGRGSESEIDSEINYYRSTTSRISSSGGHDGNFAAHRDSIMGSASIEYSMTPYPDGYNKNSTGAISYMGTDLSDSTLHPSSSHQRVDGLLPYETSSRNSDSRAWGSSATDEAVIYADPSVTVGRDAGPTGPPQRTSASTVDDQYAWSGAQDRANGNNSEAGLYIADNPGYSVSTDVRYSSRGLYVRNEDPVLTDAVAGVDIIQPAHTTAVHSPPSSIDANMGSAQVSPVAQQQAQFESLQRGPDRDRRVEVAAIVDDTSHWTIASGEGPWNPHDAAWRHHSLRAVAPNVKHC
ncbi:hypothetical protein DL766_005338 [Monosporascus sp. MC13-8B]|uniref:Uncharacterized protein n=1 Tax=Monosporascus cannonballus TaxID=155416 RepID=A0ABY0GXB4_9PEZI|nr:hypothetical protein DL762_008057 [Monosporascus cannonballus]RYO95306.1 hypothetical protein DL763_003730 [Monosporascus cannonballus]RYP29534.1 hypothetical protein DL766_005338 [Monosporascus sp. MC13-8B]